MNFVSKLCFQVHIFNRFFQTVLLEDIAEKHVALEKEDLDAPVPRSLLPSAQLENMHEMCGNPIMSPGHERRIWGGGPITNQQWPWLGKIH